jgi:hypothetical protein
LKLEGFENLRQTSSLFYNLEVTSCVYVIPSLVVIEFLKAHPYILTSVNLKNREKNK